MRDPDDQAEGDELGEGPELDDDRQDRPGFTRRLGEQLMTGLLDPDGAIRKGQGLVTGVTQATKEEVMRIVSAEMRSFLDKMDAVDLLQQVIAGMVVDVNMQIRFARKDGELQPEVQRSSTRISTPQAPEPQPADGESDDSDDSADPDAA